MLKFPYLQGQHFKREILDYPDLGSILLSEESLVAMEEYLSSN